MNGDAPTYLGVTRYRSQADRFGIFPRDRRQHIYAVGKSGTGKTTLLRNLFVQDVERGKGVALIDPHGDLSSELLDLIPPRRFDHVVYFNPADLSRPIGLNLLERVSSSARPLLVENLISTLRSIFRAQWGHRMEYILYHTLSALCDAPGTTLLGVNRMLTDERYRAWVVKQTKDPQVRAFWRDEFAAYEKNFRQEAIAPIQNKVGRLLANPILRNILGQVKSTIDLRFMIDHERILVANLAKGTIGEDAANLLGSLLVSGIQLAAMSRADTPEEERHDFHLLIDEFHAFTTDRFSHILSEARKYHLSLTVVHQYLEQMTEEVRAAVFGNVGTLVAFRVGNQDAATLAREFSPTFSADDLIGLGRYEVLLSLLIDGSASKPFSATTLPPLGKPHSRGSRLHRHSSLKYGRPRRVVEEKLTRFMEDAA